MKITLKIASIALLLFLFTNASAQKEKVGYIDSQALLAGMPETTIAKKALEASKTKIQTKLAEMQTESQKKYQEYMENDGLDPKSPEKWSDLERRDKESEIQSLQQRVQTYQSSAEQELQKKQAELYDPILKKVDAAIKKVGTDGGYARIFDVNSLLFYSPSQNVDVTDLVKKELVIVKK